MLGEIERAIWEREREIEKEEREWIICKWNWNEKLWRIWTVLGWEGGLFPGFFSYFYNLFNLYKLFYKI